MVKVDKDGNEKMKEMGESNLVWDEFFGIKKMIRETDDPEERLTKLSKKKRFFKSNWDAIDQQEFTEIFDMIEAEMEGARIEIEQQEQGGSLETVSSDSKAGGSDTGKPANYKGELTDKCIEDLEQYAKKNPKIGTERFFKAAHTQFESCRKSDTRESISWSTLRSRIKESRPDIYRKVATR